MSWTAEGGLSRGDIDMSIVKASFYANLGPEFTRSKLFWTALMKNKTVHQANFHSFFKICIVPLSLIFLCAATFQ